MRFFALWLLLCGSGFLWGQSPLVSDPVVLADLAANTKALLRETATYTHDLIQEHGREQVLKWIQDKDLEHAILEQEGVGRIRLNWVGTTNGESSSEMSRIDDRFTLFFKIELAGHPDLAILAYDPAELDVDRNTHFQQYLSRLHIENRQSLILLETNSDGDILGARVQGKPFPFSRHWLSDWWRATAKPPNRYDLVVGATSTVADLATLFIVIGGTMAANGMGLPIEPISNPLLLGILTTVYGLSLGTLNNSHRQWLMRAPFANVTLNHWVQIAKSLLISFPYNVMLKWGQSSGFQNINWQSSLSEGTLGAELTNTLKESASGISVHHPQGQSNYVDSAFAMLFGNWAKSYINYVYRIRKDQRQNTGMRDLQWPLTRSGWRSPVQKVPQKAEGEPESERPPYSVRIHDWAGFEYQVFLRQLVQIPRFLGLLGLSVMQMELGVVTMDGGDLILAAAVPALLYAAWRQAEKYQHKEASVLRRKWRLWERWLFPWKTGHEIQSLSLSCAEALSPVSVNTTQSSFRRLNRSQLADLLEEITK